MNTTTDDAALCQKIGLTDKEFIEKQEDEKLKAWIEERKRDPQPCGDCGDPTRIWDQKRQIALGKQCRCQKRRMYRGLYIDNGIPEAYHDTDLADYFVVTQNLVERRTQAVIRNRDHYIRHLPNLLADDNAGYRIKIQIDGKEKRFHSIVVHFDDMEAGRLMATDIAKACGGPSVAYYGFSDLTMLLSDFSRSTELVEVHRVFRSMPLVVIDGIERWRPNDTVMMRWNALVEARKNGGRATLIVALDDPKEAIASRHWSSLVDDCYLLRAILREDTEEIMDAPPAPPQTAAFKEPLTNRNDIEEAIIAYVLKNGSPVFSKITKEIYADKQVIGEVLDALVKSKDLVKTQKTTKNGTYEVYKASEENEAKPTAKEPIKSAGKSLAQLAEITGKGRTTIKRWRDEGLSDDEIVAKAKAT